LRDASVAFYSHRSHDSGRPPIRSRDFEFEIGVYDDVLRVTTPGSGRKLPTLRRSSLCGVLASVRKTERLEGTERLEARMFGHMVGHTGTSPP
jgi:hypothetical protein